MHLPLHLPFQVGLVTEEEAKLLTKTPMSYGQDGKLDRYPLRAVTPPNP